MRRTFSLPELLLMLAIVGATVVVAVPPMLRAEQTVVQTKQPNVGNVGGELPDYDPARLDHFVLRPTKLKLKVGQSVQLKVEAFDLKGEPMAAPPLSWLPSEVDQKLPPPKCAKVEHGLVTALRVGTCGVNAIAKPLDGLLLAVEAVEVVVTKDQGLRSKSRQR